MELVYITSMVGLLLFYTVGIAGIILFANMTSFMCDGGVCGFLGFPWEVWVLGMFITFSYICIPQLWEVWKSRK